MKTNSSFTRKLLMCLTAVAIGIPQISNAQEEDKSFEGLYRKAGNHVVNNQYAEAAATFEELISLSGGWETIVEDYGASAGGLMFDYGLVLLNLQRWADAEAAFANCIGAVELAEKISPRKGLPNNREKIAKFQLGFAKAQLGDHEAALKLYDEYLASNPPETEKMQVWTSFKLRYGSSQMKMGKMVEGIATIQEIFDNREKWKATDAFLVQGLLEIGQVWNANAMEAGADQAKRDAIEEQAIAWMDLNGGFLKKEPFDQMRFGFVDRLKKLSVGAAKSGLYSLALRYISNIPTTTQIKDDIYERVAQLGRIQGIPPAYQQYLTLIEDKEKGEVHPDVEVLRLMAICYERLGNRHAPRTIHAHVAEKYPALPVEQRAQVLHEAAKFSAEMADYNSAQYFGEKFMDEMPEDHPLRNNVATFMIQSLFTSGDYETVIKIAGDVRERYEAGDAKRELADMLYPLSLYSLRRHSDAEAPFDEYVKDFPESSNLEAVLYHRASNNLVLQKFDVAAGQLEEFLKKFPESPKYIENALSDLAIIRFNLEQYDEAIAAADRLKEVKSDSLQLARTLNVRGDAYMVKVNDAEKEDEDKTEGWMGEALASYQEAIVAGKAGEASGNSPDFYKDIVAEAMWKAADIHIQKENCPAAIELYDAFFPNYVGNRWEAQISVFMIDCLKAATPSRGEEALVQTEKMIVREGTKEEGGDLKFLREMIGSYSDASTEIRGPEETITRFNTFPGVPEDDQVLKTWLKMQVVYVLQQMRQKVKAGDPGRDALDQRIADIFSELETFEKSQLAEAALMQIGQYIARTDNKFRAVPYFEELLNRSNPEADIFKSKADYGIAKIEMENPAPDKQTSARERFRRVINKYKDKELIPDSWMYLGRLFFQNEEWKDATEAFGMINKNKTWFQKEREKRAEATYFLGRSAEQMGDLEAAGKAYIVVWSVYGGYADWVAQAFERYIPLSKKAIEELPTETPEEQLEKRKRQLDLFSLFTEQLFKWQKWNTQVGPPDGTFQTNDGATSLQRLRRDLDTMRIEYAITPEEMEKIRFDLGLPDENEGQ